MRQDSFIKIKVLTWYLKFRNNVKLSADERYLHRWKNPISATYLQMYHEVGDEWGWCGRLLLSEKELSNKLNSSDNEIWLFQPEHKVLGFFEIDFSLQGKAEIVYLGLIPAAIGKGYGKLLLHGAIATAGRKGDEVWLHTCEYDHPTALAKYLSAGFELLEEKTEMEVYPIEFLKRRKLL